MRHLAACSVAAIICAAGSSRRMGGKKKEYMNLPLHSNDKPFSVLGAALRSFALCPKIGPIVIAIADGEENAARSCLPGEFFEEEGRVLFIQGGPTRRSSAHNALLFLESFNPSHVLIHDGARPWIKQSLIERIIDGVERYGAVIPALPLVETPKELIDGLDGLKASEAGFIKRHLRRNVICAAQTPQGFAYTELLKAHEKAGERERNEGFEYTDDAEIWGEFIGQVAVIPGDPENRKITFPEDLA